jgi:predicted NBD/HSP70 family sugar kinase
MQRSPVLRGQTRAARTRRMALYLTVEAGIGGALLIEGQAVSGATGAGGEFGIRRAISARALLARHVRRAELPAHPARLGHGCEGGEVRARAL